MDYAEGNYKISIILNICFFSLIKFKKGGDLA